MWDNWLFRGSINSRFKAGNYHEPLDSGPVEKDRDRLHGRKQGTQSCHKIACSLAARLSLNGNIY